MTGGRVHGQVQTMDGGRTLGGARATMAML